MVTLIYIFSVVFGFLGLLAFIICFIEDEYVYMGCGFVVFILCCSVAFIDKEKGLVYKNVTEIQDILSYDNASEFTLAKKLVKMNIPYEDDDGNTKQEVVEVFYYSLPVKNAKNIEVQDDVQIVRYGDPKFSPALVCKYRIISKGNFWNAASPTPIDDKISWYIQIPNSAHIKEVR